MFSLTLSEKLAAIVYRKFIALNMRVDTYTVGSYGRTMLAREEFNSLAETIEYGLPDHDCFAVIARQSVTRNSGEKTTYTTVYFAQDINSAREERDRFVNSTYFPIINTAIYRISHNAKRTLTSVK